MRTNKQRLTGIMDDHFASMKADISNHMQNQIGNDNWHMAQSIEVYEVVLRNIYFSAIDWQGKYECKNLAWVRVDLIEKNLAVPVGSDYYGGKDPLPYRWLDDDEGFQILYMGVWVDAQSIDWDFTDDVPYDDTKKAEHCDGLAWLKPEILKESGVVEIGQIYYGKKEPLPYRIRGNAYFEVLHCGEWIDAERDDWTLSVPVPNVDSCTKPEDMAFLDGSKEDA